MPIDAGFWTKLATKHGLTPEQAAAIAANEALLGELNEMALRRDDFKTLQSQTESEKQAAAQAKAEAQTAYQQNLEWYGKKQADLILVDQYRERYGELTADGGGNGNGNGRQHIASPMTAEEIDKRIQNGQRQQYSLTKQLMRVGRDYERRFKEEFPFEKVEEIAMKPENSGRDLQDVYRAWIEPKVKEQETAEIEARVKAEGDKRYQEGLSKGRMREPTQMSPDDVGPLWAPRPEKDKAPDEETRIRNFTETYEKGLASERAS